MPAPTTSALTRTCRLLSGNYVACSQASGATSAWGKRALDVVAQLFVLWHRFKQHELDRPTLQQEMMQAHCNTCAAFL
jgi:hypothetical protein